MRAGECDLCGDGETAPQVTPSAGARAHYANVMTTSRVIARVTVVTLLAGLLAGCGANWRTTTYDPRRACQSFGGGYWQSDGTCHAGAP